jgi:hypothetical protein
MKWLMFTIVVLMSAGAIGQDRAAASRFVAVDLMVDPKGAPLAAWQVEVAAEVGDATLVGIESGEHAAYSKRPAYYDPAALAGKRIILGDYSLDADLPKAKTRVARLMFEVRGDAKPQYVTKLMAASDGEGKKIAAQASVIEK